MIEKQKRKLLRRIKHKELKRSEIEIFCTGSTNFERDQEISSLCSKDMIRMTEYVTLENGVFKPNPNDLFEIGDNGIDYLTNIRKDLLRTYLPIAISFMSLVVSIFAFIASIIALIVS